MYKIFNKYIGLYYNPYSLKFNPYSVIKLLIKVGKKL